MVAFIPGHPRYLIDSFCWTRFEISDVRSKQGHQALVPATRGIMSGWPSVMIEVGYSEALEFLRLDAKWWLVNSAGKTRYVMIVQLMTDPFTIHIECWAMVASEDGQKIQGSAHIPANVQLSDIDSEGTLASASPDLRIPYPCIFDEPNENAPDAVFTGAELSSFALWMFRLLR